VNRQAQAVVLLLIGGAVLRASFTDLYLRYVKQGLQPFLIAAGIALVAAAVMTLWYELRPRPAGGHDGDNGDGDGDHGDDDGHGHAGEPRVAWLLLLPVLGLLLVAPPALGSYAANRSGMALQEVSDFAPLPAGDPVRISLLDYASRAVFEDGRSIGDRRVQLTGFVMAGSDGEWYLTRMILSCCAADARPIKVALTGQVPDGLKPDSWLRIVGRYSPKVTTDRVNHERIPYVEVLESESIAAPTEQYES
jgi:uncharacterized repeat protein (TIGR03943 family)